MSGLIQSSRLNPILPVSRLISSNNLLKIRIRWEIKCFCDTPCCWNKNVPNRSQSFAATKLTSSFFIEEIIPAVNSGGPLDNAGNVNKLLAVYLFPISTTVLRFFFFFAKPAKLLNTWQVLRYATYVRFCVGRVLFFVDPYEATLVGLLVSSQRQRYWLDGDKDGADRVCRWLQPHLSSVIVGYVRRSSDGATMRMYFRF